MLTRSIIPFRALSPTPLFGEMDRQFDRLFHEVNGAFRDLTGSSGFQPALPLNMWHDDEHVYAEAELPGVSPEHLEILAEPESLTIRVERTIERPEGGEMVRSERFSGRFERTVALPMEIDADRVSADLRHGVLRITMPKAPQAQARRVQVNAG